MTVIYSLSGREEDARVQAEKVLKISPKFTLDAFKKRLTYKNKSDVEQFLGALRKAGIK